ncbi:MAG: hypothetical protein ACJA2S_004554 [Cyclobacteriaceae bacterium]|jgi:hypothetical protein
MKYLIIVVLYLFCYSSTAQQVSIITESDSVQVKIQANWSDSFLTNKGVFEYSNIIRVVFHETPSESLTKKLDSKSVPYSIDLMKFSVPDPMYAKKDDSEVIQVQGNTIKSEAINGFELREKRVIYQHVFETDLSISGLKVVIKKALKFEILNESENQITGFFQDLKVREYAREIGYTWANMPTYLDRNSIQGTIDIQMKDGRYRITISNSSLKKLIDDKHGMFGSPEGTIETLDTFALNLKGTKMATHFVKHGSRVYDYTFQKEFDFNIEGVVLDDDF